MSWKSPSQLKILNDTLDLMTLMTHAIVFFLKVLHLYPSNSNTAFLGERNGVLLCVKRPFAFS